MTGTRSASAVHVLAGALAGVAGTLALVAMESFDERYAPATVVGRAPVNGFQPRARDPLPRRQQARRLLRRAGHGALGGALYAVARGPAAAATPLGEGMAIGFLAFAHEFAWQMAAGVKPRPSVVFPALVGETVRHLAYGVATAAVYNFIDTRAAHRPLAGDVSLGI
jgi:hypothetical protein